MPRRRKTATGSANRRPRARLPDGDQGKDLSEEQKMEKLQVLLSDFDAQVAARIKQMEAEAAKNLQQIENLTRMEMLKTPKHMLELEFDDLIEVSASRDDVTIVNSINNKAVQDYASILDAKCNAVAASQKPLDTISEESDDDPGTLVKKGKKGGRVPRRKGTLKVNTSINMPPPSTSTTHRTRRTTRQQEQQQHHMMTPGFAGAPSASGWETPLVTPRFDPRLPKTPAVLRNPKPGERTMTVSLAGSPLANRLPQNMGATSYTATVPLRNNKTLVVSEDTDLEGIDPSDLGADVMQKLRILHQKLGNVLQLDSAGQ